VFYLANEPSLIVTGIEAPEGALIVCLDDPKIIEASAAAFFYSKKNLQRSRFISPRLSNRVQRYLRARR
jgi:hypothetical protein